MIKDEIQKLPDTSEYKAKFKEPFQIYHSEGCKECNGKGFSGRIALFEGFSMTRELEDIINSSPTEGKIRDEATKQGMVSLRQDGIIKALEGFVTIEDVVRVTESD